MAYVVIGWNGTALTFDEALEAGALFGVSSPHQQIITCGTGPSLPPPELASQGLSTLIVGGVLIPEPSPFALAGLGAMVFWLLRRRT